MKNLLLIFFVAIGYLSAYGQDKPFYKDYDWLEKPNYTVDDNDDRNIISLFDKSVSEFFFEGKNFVEYYLEHNVIWLNSDDKIEEYNKVYLPYYSSTEMLISKARVIKKDGKIQELDDSKILTAVDEESQNTYKYYAFEGIEKGSIIEYYYVIKRNPRYSGGRILLQSSFDKYDVNYDIYAPKNLKFVFKSYNGLSDVEVDTIMKNKNHYILHQDTIIGLEKERYSGYSAHKQSVIYKLDENEANNSRNIYNYNNISQNIFDIYYIDYTKKDKKAISKIIKQIGLKDDDSDETKIRKIEWYINLNIFQSNQGGEGMFEIPYIVKNGVASNNGVVKLYIAIFNKLNIKHQVVLTTDRHYLKFDKKFEAKPFLDNMLFYFPKYKTYLEPNEYSNYYGFPNPLYFDNYGLFIKQIKVNDFVSGVGKVKYIKPISEEVIYDKMDLSITFDEDDFSKTYISKVEEMSGFYAANFQPVISILNEEAVENLIDNLAKSIHQDAKVNKSELVNTEPLDFGVKPLIIKLDIETEGFVEKAGRKYLFKVGEVIGKQIEMYQEKARVLPIDDRFKRSYFRTIKVTIPDGYVITNLDDINIDNGHTNEEGIEIFSFKSSYVIEGNELTIKADEFYRIVEVPVNLFEEYRKVVNSAADFNKITLLMEKK